MKIVTGSKNSKTGAWEEKEYDLDEAPEDVRKLWYQSICSGKELERVMNPKNAEDYLLKLRAESILDNVRLSRLFAHFRRIPGINGRYLEPFFTDFPYQTVRKFLSGEEKKKCKRVAGGSIYTDEANGMIFQTPFGPVSTYGHTLRYFSYFSSLVLKDFADRVPIPVKGAALRVAVRIILGKETPDFEMDPRGIIPKDILHQLENTFHFQSVFLAGHELGHYSLGHIDENSLTRKALFKAKFDDATDNRKYLVYNISQKHEFEADLWALNTPKYSNDFYLQLFCATLEWFAALIIAEAVEDTIQPPNPGKERHPGAKARYANIIENARIPKHLDMQPFEETLPRLAESLASQMVEDVSHNFERYEMYGSVYLAPPNTEWRGRELIDRVDY